MDYYIKSVTKGGWWRPGGSGYTDKISEAGKFSEVMTMNLTSDKDVAIPCDEVKIPIEEQILSEFQELVKAMGMRLDKNNIPRAYGEPVTKASSLVGETILPDGRKAAVTLILSTLNEDYELRNN